MGSDEHVVGASAPIPERVVGGDDVDGGGDEGTSVSDRREAIDGAEVAGHIDRDEEEVRVIGIKSSKLAFQ